jgi:hypothetical protein
VGGVGSVGGVGGKTKERSSKAYSLSTIHYPLKPKT